MCATLKFDIIYFSANVANRINPTDVTKSTTYDRIPFKLKSSPLSITVLLKSFHNPGLTSKDTITTVAIKPNNTKNIFQYDNFFIFLYRLCGIFLTSTL